MDKEELTAAVTAEVGARHGLVRRAGETGDAFRDRVVVDRITGRTAAAAAADAGAVVAADAAGRRKDTEYAEDVVPALMKKLGGERKYSEQLAADLEFARLALGQREAELEGEREATRQLRRDLGLKNGELARATWRIEELEADVARAKRGASGAVGLLELLADVNTRLRDLIAEQRRLPGRQFCDCTVGMACPLGKVELTRGCTVDEVRDRLVVVQRQHDEVVGLLLRAMHSGLNRGRTEYTGHYNHEDAKAVAGDIAEFLRASGLRPA